MDLHGDKQRPTPADFITSHSLEQRRGGGGAVRSRACHGPRHRFGTQNLMPTSLVWSKDQKGHQTSAKITHRRLFNNILQIYSYLVLQLATAVLGRVAWTRSVNVIHPFPPLPALRRAEYLAGPELASRVPVSSAAFINKAFTASESS